MKLEWTNPRGYLDSVLKALDIDPSSQSLVFSKTSLQIAWISEKTPRAIYFDDETYVAWVEGAPTLEMMGVDSVMGPVFYTLDNRNPGAAVKLERETTPLPQLPRLLLAERRRCAALPDGVDERRRGGRPRTARRLHRHDRLHADEGSLGRLVRHRA